MTIQKGFKVDINQCIGCRACEAACKVEFNLHALQGRRRQVIENTVDESGVVRTFFTSLACNHCVDPACLKACPQGAYTKDIGDGTMMNKDASGNVQIVPTPDGNPLTSTDTAGVVLHDPTKCIGCRLCEWACPYGAPQYNATTNKVHKCEACWQRVKNPDLHSSRQVPACVATCIGGALKWVDVDPADDLEPSIDGVALDYCRPGAGNLTDCPDPGTGYNNRGSQYLASHVDTNPALKVKNRVYKTRTGGVE